MLQGITSVQCYCYYGIYCCSYSILNLMLFSVVDNYAILHMALDPFYIFATWPATKEAGHPDLTAFTKTVLSNKCYDAI